MPAPSSLGAIKHTVRLQLKQVDVDPCRQAA